MSISITNTQYKNNNFHYNSKQTKTCSSKNNQAIIFNDKKTQNNIVKTAIVLTTVTAVAGLGFFLKKKLDTSKIAKVFNKPKLETTVNKMNTIDKKLIESVSNKKIKVGDIEFMPISNDAEFEKVYNKVKNSKLWNEVWEHADSEPYENIINGYAGKADISDVINRYLTGRKYEFALYDKVEPEIIKDYVRLLEYSFQKLDSKLGTYEGFVTRSGYFSEKGGQYYSTAKGFEGSAKHRLSFDSHPDFEIIYTRNGHKINDFHKKFELQDDHIAAFLSEEEIVLPLTNKYRVVTEITPEMQRLKDSFIETIIKKRPNLDAARLQKRIKIYEQI